MSEEEDIQVDGGEEEDPEDPQEVLREKCGETKKCLALREKLDTCSERVSSKSKTSETCTEELFDFIHCIDHCAAKSLLKHLK
ncbi:Cytochrome b-c1 complex subunit 6, mitochondrial [Geodia barretti]|uniref:Cytochrome b-c1 complex subunit 6 n=1 Tax=Geodia barretti TaxID=519541 RepID=A0AA35XH02_GEOBA|nr:Cytochrome b-c1 complex subunit 6, mitochondrial [Geodia barretti]